MTPAGIDTAKLYPILMSSGLPREALGQIWASANRTTPGMLTKEELYTVLALIGVAQVNTAVETNHPLKTTSLIFPISLMASSLKSHQLMEDDPHSLRSTASSVFGQVPVGSVWQEASYHPQCKSVTITIPPPRWCRSAGSSQNSVCHHLQEKLFYPNISSFFIILAADFSLWAPLTTQQFNPKSEKNDLIWNACKIN